MRDTEEEEEEEEEEEGGRRRRQTKQSEVGCYDAAHSAERPEPHPNTAPRARRSNYSCVGTIDLCCCCPRLQCEGGLLEDRRKLGKLGTWTASMLGCAISDLLVHFLRGSVDSAQHSTAQHSTNGCCTFVISLNADNINNHSHTPLNAQLAATAYRIPHIPPRIHPATTTTAPN